MLFLLCFSLLRAVTLDTSFFYKPYNPDFWAIINFRIPKNHQIYINKSDFPTLIKFKSNENYQLERLVWSIPKLKFNDDGSSSYIYSNSAFAIAHFIVKKIPERLTTEIQFLECGKDICIPHYYEKTFETGKSISEKEFLQFYAQIQQKGDPVVTRNSLNWWSIALAFLGGLLLNIMPCVFPVLSIKMLHIIKHKQNLVRSCFLYALGVIVTFIGIAFLLFFMKMMGHNIGWGFQLQSPIFVFILSIVFLLISLNLFDIFEVPETFPSSFKNVSSFFNGVLTTVVSTPCTTPFMGSALAYAFIQNYYVIFLVFLSLGLGMAFPILCLPFFPGIVRIMPKPGMWMVHVRHSFGFMLLATLIWLIYIFASLTNIDILFWILISLLIMAFGIWLISKNIFLGIFFICVGLFSGFYHIYIFEISTSNQFESFNKEQLKILSHQKKPVLVFFTANWCLTCKMNYRVLKSPRIMKKIKEKQVKVMIGDWTKRDDDITEFLSENRRMGVPFMVLYLGNKKYILPEFLTESILLNYLDKINENNTITFS